jgi:hypothetical protein
MESPDDTYPVSLWLAQAARPRMVKVDFVKHEVEGFVVAAELVGGVGAEPGDVTAQVGRQGGELTGGDGPALGDQAADDAPKIYELMKVFPSPEELREEIVTRRGRSILHGLNDPKLEQLADFVLDQLDNWPVYADIWTVWVAEKQVRPDPHTT